MGYMQSVPLPSAAPLSANGAHTIQVYDADGVRISFVCVKDPNDHFRYMPVDELFFKISGAPKRSLGTTIDLTFSGHMKLFFQCHYHRYLHQRWQHVCWNNCSPHHCFDFLRYRRAISNFVVQAAVPKTAKVAFTLLLLFS
jgi:hypothetical protein